MQREELFQLLTNGRAELERLIAMVPADQKEAHILTNGWSVKDLLGHLGFWEERALSLYHWFAGGPEPSPKPGTANTDQINEYASASIRGRSLADLTRSESAAYQAMVQLVQTAPEADLFDPQRFPLAEGNAFVGWIEGNTYGHYAEHLQDLRGWLGLPGMIDFSADGQTVHAYVTYKLLGGPGLVVLHPWWGLNDFIKRLCDRLAAEGYTVIAPDLFNGKMARTIEEAEKLVQGSDSDYVFKAATSSVDQLRKIKGVPSQAVGALGFSFGAAWALVLADARAEDVSSTVLFYGSYPREFEKSRSAYLGHFAENDPFEPKEGILEQEGFLKKGGREVNFYFYPGTGHWFFEDDRPDAYNPQAAELAWSRTLEFLNLRLK